MTTLLSPTNVLFVKASPGDFMAMEEGYRACGDSDSYIDPTSQKKIEKERPKVLCEGARRQLFHGVEVALAYWNKSQKSNGEPQYVLVEARTCSPFWQANSWWYHTNFKAKIKDDPAAEPEFFFAEVKGLVHAKRGHKVTKICVLLPTDKGLNGCKVCKIARHPESGGFNLGQAMCTVDPNVRQNVKKLKARKLKAEAKELKAKEQSVATRTRSRTSDSSEGSMSNN